MAPPPTPVAVEPSLARGVVEIYCYCACEWAYCISLGDSFDDIFYCSVEMI